ncbi:hypothetical protein [Euzebya tangerina]|uniref:hypothetical protein n=1 Tax=Euzebya tangerina TaxID=591198 RepID=UPI0013C2D421|nr:hypothetical protein [Euzebya tangerina]
MDLDDLLEDLLEDAGKAAKRTLRSATRSKGSLLRRYRRPLQITAAVSAVFFGLVTAALAFVGDPGLLRWTLAAATLVITLSTAAVAVTLREPRARTRRRKSGSGRSGTSAPAVTPTASEEPTLPPGELAEDVRDEWSRLLQARTLVHDLTADGWIHEAATAELDMSITRLHRLLATDRRTEQLGGTPSAPLRAQVSELADLLVALADEAVHLQADGDASQAHVQATLADARDHLVALRQARAELTDPGVI